MVRRKPEVVMRFKERDKVENKTKPLSVLLIGIDSISRLNLIRAMPNTAQHLYNTGWMELKGYNKVNYLKSYLLQLSNCCFALLEFFILNFFTSFY